MIGRLLSFVTSSTLLVTGIALLLAVWKKDAAFQLLSEYPLFAALAALFLLLLATINFKRKSKLFPSYTFNIARGKGTVSIDTLKKGIQTFVRSEDPRLEVISCQLKEGGKLLELTLAGQTEPTVLEHLSNLLADQFGFEGQLEVFFER